MENRISCRFALCCRRHSPGGLALAIVLSLAVPSVLPAQPVILKDAFPNLTFPGPVDLQHAGDGTNRLFVVRQAGYIEVVDNSPAATSSKTFLDIDSQVVSGGELGLLGLAFHPAYESNGYFFVNYTAASPLRTVVSRFTVSPANPDSADRWSEVILLQFDQPYNNHNGGQLAFGPDGYLYVATGDGGSGGDPQNNGQNRSALLGKILRIDVDVPADTFNYSIPPGNPFAGNVNGYREEIFAWGFRNPWRFSFDAATGTPWVGDVGQGDWEEVDILVNGGNYGWRLKEGTHCYDPPDGCDTIPGLTDPVWEYAHDGSGGCSITGGYVYRGAAIPSLYGKYLYGDYCTGRIWALDSSGAGGWVNVPVLDTTRNITSFGVDSANEVYVCSAGDGKIFKLVPLHPPVPTLQSPGDGSMNLPPNPELRWYSSPSATRYHLQVGQDPGFTVLALDDTTLTDTGFTFVAGPGMATWYWRVRAGNSVGWSPFSPAWSFSTDSVGEGWYVFAGGWNLVSLPVGVADGRKDSVFPGAISAAYGYDPDSKYSVWDSLVPGTGYWVKFGAAQLVAISGAPRSEDTLGVLAGWNLIGGLTGVVDVDSITADPPGILASRFFGYDGSYYVAPALAPARGYWVKLSASGTLVLRSPGTALPAARRGGRGGVTTAAD